jgi:hypothetical protein
LPLTDVSAVFASAEVWCPEAHRRARVCLFRNHGLQKTTNVDIAKIGQRIPDPRGRGEQLG